MARRITNIWIDLIIDFARWSNLQVFYRSDNEIFRAFYNFNISKNVLKSGSQIVKMLPSYHKKSDQTKQRHRILKFFNTNIKLLYVRVIN